MDEISEEAKYVFILSHLRLVWPWLWKLGIDTKKIAAQCWKEYDLLTVEMGNVKQSPALFFLDFGVEVLQPMMNKKLNRPKDFPTFVRMMEYLMEPFIKEDQNALRIRSERLSKSIYSSVPTSH